MKACIVHAVSYLCWVMSSHHEVSPSQLVNPGPESPATVAADIVLLTAHSQRPKGMDS